MDIFINTAKSPASVPTKSTGYPLTSLRAKRGGMEPLAIAVQGTDRLPCSAWDRAKGKVHFCEGELHTPAEANSGTQTELGTRSDLKQVASFRHAPDSHYQRHYPTVHGCSRIRSRGISCSGFGGNKALNKEVGIEKRACTPHTRAKFRVHKGLEIHSFCSPII